MARHRLMFWLGSVLTGMLAALIATLVVALCLTLIAGVDQFMRRGTSIMSLFSAAKGVGLLLVYAIYFSLYVMPFSALAVPLCYLLASRVAGGKRIGARLVFVTLAVVFGTAGPYLLDHAAWALYKFNNPAAFGVPSLWPIFTMFGLFAAPVAALAIWPVLQRLDERFRTAATASVDVMSVPTS